MNDIIHLLPDSVANQIAAGEVIQRPGSAVKELLENAVDAGATEIQLIIKDSGKTLIQVTDNGAGMSFNDARLCFERHATSKITCADDLFTLTTKGFRGEALASIAAIAHVELKTKRKEEAIGTQVLIEGSEIKEHSPIATQDGTSIAIKNLFYNVPARRNFLKSETVEFTHIEEEFNRVALIHTNIAFSLYHNGKVLVQLQPSNFKQRIINLFGAHFKDKLFPTEQITDIIKISGFIAKPENAKKKKSEQYLFINNRFVRHSLLNYAIESAYSELIPSGYKPAYFIHLELNPTTIDINISPTKVEVKLQDERLVFGFLNSCVKKSLGALSLTPRLDFDYERGLDISGMPENKELTIPPTGVNPHYNPFDSKPSVSGKSGFTATSRPHSNIEGWEDFLKNIKTEHSAAPSETATPSTPDLGFSNRPHEGEELRNQLLSYFLLQGNYLVVKLYNQLTLIDIVRGRERILYETYLKALQQQPVTIQQNLFPETITLSTGSAELLLELKEDLFKLGYDIEPIDKNSFAVNGTPMEEAKEEVQHIIEQLLESYKANIFLYRSEREKNLALSLAKQKRSLYKELSTEQETAHFLSQLLSCEVPYTSPSGKKIMHTFAPEEISHLF